MKRFLCCMMMVLCAGSAFAVGGGSSYSILGLGDIRMPSGVRSAGMGYTGTALPGANYINLLSPSTWARINRTRIEASFLMEGFHSREAGSSRYLANGTFGGVALAIPISEAHGIVFTGGFTPFSTIDYDAYSRSLQGGIDYSFHNVGSGGFSKGRAGLSYAPGNDLAVGAAVEYLSGSITRTTTFTPTDPTLSGGTTKDEFSARGVGVLLGATYTGLGNIADALRPATIGFSFSSRTTLRGSTLRTSTTTSEEDSTSNTSGSIAIPYMLSIGAAYQPGSRTLIAADYSFRPWSSGDLTGLRPENIRDSYRIGVGIERFGSSEQFATWLQKTALRAGFYYEHTYYTVGRTGINAWGITAGAALPLSGETRLNVAAEYGNRGTATLIKDNIIRLSVSLNISEVWFVQYGTEE